MGFKAYRFSISWARIYTNGDDEKPNEKGIAFYNNVINELQKYNIEPIVTILHCDLPLALEKKYGGWMSRKVINDFARYAETLFKLFGDRVKYWLTYNEQNMSYMYSSYDGIKKESDRYVFNHILNLAQAKAMIICHQLLPKAFIGTVPNIVAIYAKDSSPENNLGKINYDKWRNGMVLDPLYKGKYPASIIKFLHENDLMFEITEEDKNLLERAKPNFLGFNYYGTTTVEAMSASEKRSYNPFEFAVREIEVPGIAREIKNPLGSYTPYGMGYDPVGLRITMRELYERYNVPLMITENGYGEVDIFDANGNVEDDYRIAYLKEHIIQVGEAIHDGVKCLGYLPWSAIDLVSVSQGITKRYGFVYVNRDEFDMKDLKRSKKKSFYWYKKVIETNGNEL